MTIKETTLSAGNAADRLKSRRAMPSFALSAPLPPEGAPAVTVVASRAKPVSKRSYRISTYLTEEAGARLLRLVAHLKSTRGRRHGAPDVLEQALLALEKQLGLG